MRQSLFTRFTLPYIILILAVMIGLNLAVSSTQKTLYTRNLETRLLAEARGLAFDVGRMIKTNSIDTDL
jgi:hypothetical protein